MPEAGGEAQPVGDVVPEWRGRPWPTALGLTGTYVALEPLAPGHAAALQESLGGPDQADLWTYRPHDPPVDVAAMTHLIEQLLAAPDVEHFAVVPTGGTASGLTSLMRIDPAHGQVEVAGVLYARHLQRSAATTEATYLLMRDIFDELGYRRLEWKCDSLNEPSRRAAARLGFTYEGRFRQHMVIKGRNRDTDWFSVTDSEWPAIRAELERWLGPDNFDAESQQRSRLSIPARP